MRSSHTWGVIAEPAAFGTPTEPPASRWALKAPMGAPAGQDLVAVGADLHPGTMLAAYRAGLFPMGTGVGGADPLGWWSPDPRGVIGPGDLHISRSMLRTLRRFEFSIDADLEAVLAGCADVSRPGRWITAELLSAYRHLHALGFVHSVEVWEGGELVGGLFGLSIGGLFAGESMFRRRTDASKAALVALVRHLEAPTQAGDGAELGPWLIDVQWCTEHLASLGARAIPRRDYLCALPEVVGGRHRWPSTMAARRPHRTMGPSGAVASVQTNLGNDCEVHRAKSE